MVELNCALDQALATTPGSQYSISYDISSFTMIAVSIDVRIGTSLGGVDVLQEAISANGSFSHNFTATSAISYLKIGAYDVTGGSFFLDNVEIPGIKVVTLKEGGLAQLLSGMADNSESLRVLLKTAGSIRDPYTTPMLSDLEIEYGIPPNKNIPEQERREKLAAVKYARPGTGTKDDLQLALNRAFPDSGLMVYANDPARDPRGVLGTNLLKDGNMEDTSPGIPFWSTGGSATLSKQTTTPRSGLRCLRVARSTVNNPYAHQSPLVSGLRYRVSGWARSDGFAIPSVVADGQQLFVGTTSTEWQPFEFFVDVGTASVQIQLFTITSTGTEYCEFDEVSVQKVPDLIVNGRLFKVYTDWSVGCDDRSIAGVTLAQCGEPTALSGENNGIITESIDYVVPAASSYWSLIFFVGGQARYASVLADGDMGRTDLDAWTGVGVLSKETSDPYHGERFLRVTNGSGIGSAAQIVLTAGLEYRVIGWMRSDGAAGGVALVRNGGALLKTVASSTWTRVDFTFTATSTSIELAKASDGVYADFDDFQVFPTAVINQTECGEPLAQCGEPTALAGQMKGIISIDDVDINAIRQRDLERIILAIKPMHSWGQVYANYIGSAV
jgi:hypothetical protein